MGYDCTLHAVDETNASDHACAWHVIVVHTFSG
jgi:hypothetical protein